MRLTSVFAYAFIAFTCISVARAQGGGSTGIPPLSTVAGGPDEINLADLSFQYFIPVFSRTGRLPFSFSVPQQNVIWNKVPNGTGTTWSPWFAAMFTDIGAVTY